MIVEHVLFTSLSEIDFNSMFEASYERMKNGTTVWNPSLTTKSKRKAWLKKCIRLVMTWSNSFCIKGSIDGHVISVIFGTRDGDVFQASVTLERPDRSGTMVYTNDAAKDNLKEMLAINGVISLVGHLPEGFTSEAILSNPIGNSDPQPS